MPEAEKKFQTRYRKSPSFLSIHMGVKADALPDNSDVHHMVLEVRNTEEQESNFWFANPLQASSVPLLTGYKLPVWALNASKIAFISFSSFLIKV
jgi:hypothetical protein